MARTTIYCVQPFWRAGATKLARGDLRQFLREDSARRAGECAARKQGGAIVFAVVGDPEFEHWEAPRLIAQHGDVPVVEF